MLGIESKKLKLFKQVKVNEMKTEHSSEKKSAEQILKKFITYYLTRNESEAIKLRQEIEKEIYHYLCIRESTTKLPHRFTPKNGSPLR